MQQFLCQRIELGFDELDFFVDLAMLSAKMMSSLFLKIVNLSHCLELEKDVNHVMSQIPRFEEDSHVLPSHGCNNRNCRLVRY